MSGFRVPALASGFATADGEAMDGSIEETLAAAGGAYRVLARKYRPQSFADLIGQEPMVRTLTNAFRTGRIAQAYMLTGVRGVGKTTTARILARALNYADPRQDRPADHRHGASSASTARRSWKAAMST